VIEKTKALSLRDNYFITLCTTCKNV